MFDMKIFEYVNWENLYKDFSIEPSPDIKYN